MGLNDIMQVPDLSSKDKVAIFALSNIADILESMVKDDHQLEMALVAAGPEGIQALLTLRANRAAMLEKASEKALEALKGIQEINLAELRK